jgi:chromosome segregation ATPase
MNELTTLSTLAVEINLLDEQVEHHKNQAVIYAAREGVVLNKAKEDLGNDKAKFVEWLEKNCTVKVRNAYNYIRLSKDMPQLLESSVQTSALSLSQAIELLSAPEDVKTEVTAKIEAGEDVTVKEIQRLKKEAAELLIEKQAIQNDLIGAKQAIEEKEKRVNWLELDKQATTKQNDELRNTLTFEVDKRATEKLELERAKLILENQQAIADAKRKAENLASELERLKKEQDKSIKDGVARELSKLDTQISQKQYDIERQERMIADLRKTYAELDVEVGALAVHKTAIKEIKEDLSSLAVSFSDAFETETIPPETVSDWTAIYDALNKLVAQMREWRENNTLIGELVD